MKTESPAVAPKTVKGRWIHRKSGETYQLTVVPDDLHERTHKLRNEVHSWEGTEEEFKSEFEKV